MVSLVALFFDLRAAMQNLLHFGADFEVAKGRRRQPMHPWKGWGIKNLHEGHLVEPSKSYETLKEHVERLFFKKEARRMNEISVVLYITGTKGENFVSNGVA